MKESEKAQSEGKIKKEELSIPEDRKQEKKPQEEKIQEEKMPEKKIQDDKIREIPAKGIRGKPGADRHRDTGGRGNHRGKGVLFLYRP